MKSEANLHGIIHGRTIELTHDPGLPEGQEIDVTLRVIGQRETWGQGVGRAAGALSETWNAQDDEILEQIYKDRQRSASREALP